MPLAFDALPLPTPFDPIEEPPGSIDPLGTLSHAERLADLLLPGLTARMWRVRLVTLATLAVAVAERVLDRRDAPDATPLEARLCFERLVVSALIRLAKKRPEEGRGLARRLPGSALARTALEAGQPLTPHNFLKGEAVNGLGGVMARLAQHLGTVDQEGGLGQRGPDLLCAWADDQELPGVLDDDGRRGAAWAQEAARQVSHFLTRNDWPGPGAGLWQRLAEPLRLDQLGGAERRVLGCLLRRDEVRGRVLDILRERPEVYSHYSRQPRGVVEREVLLQTMRPALGNSPVDRLIRAISFAIHVYETAAVWLQQGFDGILWALSQQDGRAEPTELLAQPALQRSLDRVVVGLRAGVRPIDAAIAQLREVPVLDRIELTGPFAELRDDVVAGGASPAVLADALLLRHARVQREKRKGLWIDRDTRWTLLPGFGIGGESPPEYGATYIHPLRLVNAYALLSDLGEVPAGDVDDED